MNKLEKLKKKILYRSSYRGTKELDILLSSFVKSHIEKLTEIELTDLDKFLNLEDELIYNFYNNDINYADIEENKISKMFKRFKI
jgi:antitoxin CptB